MSFIVINHNRIKIAGPFSERNDAQREANSIDKAAGYHVAEVRTVTTAPITITIHTVTPDDPNADDDDSYMVSDDGGEFDDSEAFFTMSEAEDDANEREDHYHDMGRVVVRS